MRSLTAVEIPKYVIGATADHRIAAAAIQLGARDYLALPKDLELLRRLLDRERREAAGRGAAARFAEDERRLSGFDTLVGESPELRRVIEQGRRVAQHRDVTVLIGGETGTGKELVARALHDQQPARQRALRGGQLRARFRRSLLESELFGHERGAFTGAIARQTGAFELADGGTIFLDEIGELPLELQPKLLRVLESGRSAGWAAEQTRHGRRAA